MSRTPGPRGRGEALGERRHHLPLDAPVLVEHAPEVAPHQNQAAHGVVAVTVAVRRADVSSAISPTKSPASRVAMRFPPASPPPSPRRSRRTHDRACPPCRARCPQEPGDPRSHARARQILLRQPLEQRRPRSASAFLLCSSPPTRRVYNRSSVQLRHCQSWRAQRDTRRAASSTSRTRCSVTARSISSSRPGYMSHLEQNQWWPPYKAFLDRMASFSRLIVFDRRGTGLSDRILDIGCLRGDGGRRSRRDGRGGLRAGSADRRCRGRADLRALRRDVPGADIGAHSRRRPTPDGGGRPTIPGGSTRRRSDAILAPTRHSGAAANFGLRSLAPSRRRRRAVPGVVRAGLPLRGHAVVRARLVPSHDGDRHSRCPACDPRAHARHPSRGDQVIPAEAGRYLAEHIPDAKLRRAARAATTCRSRTAPSRRSTRSRSS